MKRIFQAMSVASIAFMMALVGFVATLASRGALSPQRVDAAVAALRGEAAASQPAASQVSMPAASQTSRGAAPVGEMEESIRIERMELDRRKREIADQWDLLKTAQMELLRDKEKFAGERRNWQEQVKRQMEEASLSGAAKELEYLSGIKAVLAKDLLRQKRDADVVQLLLQMESRTGRKIIESCKTEEERQWIGRILEQLRQRNDRQAEALNAGKP